MNNFLSRPWTDILKILPQQVIGIVRNSNLLWSFAMVVAVSDQITIL